MTYSFAPEQLQVDPEKILGVDLGEALAICASSVSEYGRFIIEGGEVTSFAARLEASRRSLQRQAAYCGEGRTGHGAKTRVSDVYKAQDKIANFRDTINHRYSKALVDYAVKHLYGVIQMEDLSGIKNSEDFPKFLRHWTYYDLQSKIENKAREQGIRAWASFCETSRLQPARKCGLKVLSQAMRVITRLLQPARKCGLKDSCTSIFRISAPVATRAHMRLEGHQGNL